ncbi:hypothetical protein SAZ_37590 [Streptomyces noursei ZPM]|nr:hypothetical protein SAZ_37590 [Streptomyces noursei ZPM]EPY92098.1 hypothetical protein K530_55115 [Streptomyces noursei CCRC 11814]EXU85263.1 hypothetical protein P354_11985 [Streptomyces noursei PD-1]
MVRLIEGGTGLDGRWLDGVAQAVGLFPPGGTDPRAGGRRLRQFTSVDPAVARRVARHAARS